MRNKKIGGKRKGALRLPRAPMPKPTIRHKDKRKDGPRKRLSVADLCLPDGDHTE